ncbi:hypothetical protein [Kitasatospora terrestris]|uniref:Uncharacterized protein n=1 Tax=Kitasatospora terrestris TaxID=258051 RepID=A0ABP9DUW1_9ACTN
MAEYRRFDLNLWAEAPPERAGVLAAELTAAFTPYGTVRVEARGPYGKIPELLEFEVVLTPDAALADCAAAIGIVVEGEQALWSRQWGGRLLLPSVHTVTGSAVESARPPRFTEGQAVRGPDGPAVVGSAHTDGESWTYWVELPDGSLRYHPEADLASAGTRAPA